MFLTVVCCCLSISLKCNFKLSLSIGYCKCSLGLCYFVVVCLCISVQCITECIGTASFYLLTSGEGICCSFSVYKAALYCKRCFTVYECYSIIRFAQIRTLQRYRSLVDSKLSFDNINLKSFCYIFAIGILYCDASDFLSYRCIVFTCICSFSFCTKSGHIICFSACRNLNAVWCYIFKTGHVLFASIINRFQTVSSYCNFILFIIVCF